MHNFDACAYKYADLELDTCLYIDLELDACVCIEFELDTYSCTATTSKLTT